MTDEMKRIKCSRCRCLAVVPSEWTYKECQSCHARTVQRRGRKSAIRKQMLIQSLASFEQYYENAKRFMPKLSRERCLKDYLESREKPSNKSTTS